MAAPAFRGLRRDIALVLGGKRQRTLYETAKALGRRSGDIQRVVRQMYEEGILEADDPEPTQGTVYWLSERGATALMEEIAEGVIPGRLANDQQLLVVTATDRRRFYHLVAQKDLAGVVAWACKLGGDGEWLIAIDPKADLLHVERLHIALTGAGFACRTHLVCGVLDAAELRAHATSAADTEESIKSLGLKMEQS